MILTKHLLFAGLCLLLSVSCTRLNPEVWHSLPADQRVSADSYDLQLAPLRQGTSFFIGFHMIIKNETAQPIQIDWNATRYLFNDSDQGVFVFKGLDPETVKNSIPAEEISAGATFEKDIVPVKTIGFHLREKAADSTLRFTPGPLPAGSNGIRLVLTQNGNQWRETLSFRLRVETVPAN